MQILLAILIFLGLIQYIVFFDVILSWLTLLWINFRPKFISDILNPIYSNIKKILPTTMWPIDFTPIVILILCSFFKWIIFLIFPEARDELIKLLN